MILRDSANIAAPGTCGIAAWAGCPDGAGAIARRSDRLGSRARTGSATFIGLRLKLNDLSPQDIVGLVLVQRRKVGGGAVFIRSTLRNIAWLQAVG